MTTNVSASFACALFAAAACACTSQGSTSNGAGGTATTTATTTASATGGTTTATGATSSAATGTGGGPAAGLSKIGTGEYETFYLKDGTIYAYGGGGATLGLGSYQGVAIPPRAIATPVGLKFLDVQGGLHQSMAIDENHHVWTWGDTSSGLSGSGTSGGDPTQPYQVTEDVTGQPFDGIVAIEPETAFNAALKMDGTVWVWGNCANGVTGDGTAGGVVQKPTKVPIPLPAGVTITKISAAGAMLALASDGSVWAWGPAEDNVLGTGDGRRPAPFRAR